MDLAVIRGTMRGTICRVKFSARGIVLNASPNSATVLVTTLRKEIYSGDYVELE